MKILAATLNYDHPQTGQLAALREIATELVEFDYMQAAAKSKASHANQAFIDLAVATQPDWIWMQLQDSEIITADTLKHIRQRVPGCVLTHWTGDLRREVSRYLSSICAATHATFISSVGQIGMFMAAGAPLVEYVQIGLDVEHDVLGNPHWEPPFRVPEIVFCGNCYGPQFPGTQERMGALRALIDDGLDVGVVGGGWPAEFNPVGWCHVKQQFHVWKRARVALSINNYNDIVRYYSDRQLISMASGTPVVARHVPSIEAEFQHGKHCLFYKTRDELLECVRSILRDREAAEAMGAAGRAEVIANHTWQARIRQVLPTIERLRSTR